MNNFALFRKQIQKHLFLMILISNLGLVTLLLFCDIFLKIGSIGLTAILVMLAVIVALLVSVISTKFLIEPLKLIMQAVLHVSPNQSNYPAPNLESIKIGRELITGLSHEVYEMASLSADKIPADDQKTLSQELVMNNFPLPLIMVDKTQKIVYVNASTISYFGMTKETMINKNMYDLLDLSFSSENTFDKWLTSAQKSNSSAITTWEHVRLPLPAPIGLKQFDMAASFMPGSTGGVETVITLFDHSLTYNQDDQSISFVAIAVHELRNPVTLLRGYIDVFEEELSGKLSDELADFMIKMQVSAGQLSAFINNILNVSRVENDRLTLELSEQVWPDIIKSAIDGISLRAKVHKKTIEYTPPAKLPTAGVDKVSIFEAVSNLLDNAIKYSGEINNKIIVKTELTKDGLIETTIQDFGTGIASNVLPKLFEKFYRSHRTQATVGGTGLGLYLSKAIIDAHGGNIWVNSKEGEGTTFGFTVLPYVMVANKIKSSNNAITRNAHGWIKNHLLVRR